MKEKVYFIKIKDNDDDSSISQKIEDTIKKKELLSFIQPKDMVAVKTHFGEENTKGYIRPVYMKALNKLLKEKKALPFLTETSTLYRGKRTNAIEHIEHANQQGFTIENTGMSIIMADGLVGDEEVEVEIPGKHYDKVGVASLMSKVQATLFITHFTGHMISGFGGSIKNMGMGCTSSKAKVKQHYTSKPAVKQKKCVGCEDCYRWCPHDAIT
ncbi:MAG: DUF362 domain-containing protein, partial [bacterium]|nr:DUF362 domain-containing protein [bacterium]